MMNRMNVLDLSKKKNTTFPQNIQMNTKDKSLFSEIFSSKKENYSTKKQNIIDRPSHDKLTIKSKKEISNGNLSKPSNKPTEILTNDTDKISINSIDEAAEGRDEITNKKISLDSLDDESLNHIIALLQSINVLLEFDVENVVQSLENQIMINPDEMVHLTDLKDQLTLLINTAEINSNDSFNGNLKEILSTINEIVDKASLDEKSMTLVEKDAFSEVATNLDELKKDLGKLLNNLSSDKQNDLAIPKASDNVELVGVQEEYILDDSNSINNFDDKNRDSRIKTKGIDEIFLEDRISVNDSLKLEDSQGNQITNDITIAVRQEKSDYTVNGNVSKNEIIEPKKLISEIAQKAGAFLSKDKNEMSIQLTPENLGKISIKIGINDGTVTGKIYAENYSVKEIIETNLNQLKDSLQEKGLNIAGLEVHIGDNSKNFNRNLFQSRYENKQKLKGTTGISNKAFVTLSQEVDEMNPYLITGQFEGSV